MPMLISYKHAGIIANVIQNQRAIIRVCTKLTWYIRGYFILFKIL